MKKTITLFAFLTVLTIFPFLTAFSQCGCSSITFLGDPIPSGSDFTVSADICFGGNACPGGGAFGDSYGVIINFTGANVTAATPSITNPISSVTLNASGVGTNNIQYGNPFFPIIPPFHDAVLDGAQLCYTVSFTFDAYPSAWSGGGQEVGNCFGNNLFTPFCPDNAGTPSPAGPLTVCFNDASQTIDATGFTLHNTPNACIGWGLWVMNDPLGVYTGNPGVSGIGTPPSGGDPNSDPNFDGLIGTGTTLNIPALNNGVTYQICGLTLSDCVANPAQYDPTCFDVSNVCVEVFMNTQIQIVPIAINCDEDFCDDCLEYNVLIAGGDAEANGTTYSVDIDVNGTVTTVTGVNDGDIITIGNITNPGSVPVGAGTISITVTDAAGCTQTFSPSIPLDGDDYCGNTCGADAGTVTVTITGDTKDAGVYDGSIDPTSTVGPFILCFTDGLELMSNMDFTEPPTGPDPGMSYSINEGFPVAALLDQDPKWTGIFWTGELTITSDPYLNNTYQNTMHLIRTCF
ncbi:MAG: hypothetical protein IPN25_10900 [Sphingobacteriales bacterium]|nr:hypothetical protein [Sphingobacteriales bacterium]